ncbi:MAG: flagellar assembly protein FliW [Proteobacteria bacterium]|nr:flagellar assembly protein FliW [Pseudomonadota bacterium]MBU1687467.1 flagellar assembly protein FliW [Pseudomonadota bacterium]
MEAAVENKTIVNTTRFGQVEIDPDRVVTLVAPLWGFPHATRFFLQKHSNKSPLMWLQSLDDPGLAFVVSPPSVVSQGYKPEVNDGVKSELMIGNDREMDILLILTVPGGRPQDMTANLLAPVVINVKKRLARQVLLDPNRYDPCHPVFERH